jgi:extracellular factor (EF) 3-hydroxypalmitic acid methyl ester biosynthesis protein
MVSDPLLSAVSSLNAAYDRLVRGCVDEGITALVTDLDRLNRASSPEEYQTFARQRCLVHPLRDLIHQDPYASRSFHKPRGFAGDALLLDFFYGLNGPTAETTTLGREIFHVSMARPASESVRYRRTLLANLIDEMASEKSDTRILSIACGHLREAALSEAVQQGRVSEMVCIDQDAESIAVVERETLGLPVKPAVGSIRSLLSGEPKYTDFDLVYAGGVFDYLPLSVATRLTAAMFRMLRADGRLLVTNFTPETEERGYMEAFMDWYLIYRNEASMVDLARKIDPSAIQRQRVFRDPLGNIVYLEVTRS